MKELGFWIYLMIGLGAAISMDIKATQEYPRDNGFRIFSAVVSVVAWPIYIGSNMVAE